MRDVLAYGTFVAAVFLATIPASAQVQEFDDKDAWTDAVGAVTRVGFAGPQQGTVITDQYQEQGVLFTDGDDTVVWGPQFTSDFAGLDGNGDINVTFDVPEHWICVDYPGFVQLELFSGGETIYLSDPFPGGAPGSFAGLLSQEPFDAARIAEPGGGEAVIDDLHFGHPPLGPVLELEDKEEWIAAVGEFRTIDFTGFPQGTIITDQFVDQGILFTDGNDSIHFAESFPNDGVGLADGLDQNITMLFDTPRNWIAVDYPGALDIELFSEGESVYPASAFGCFGNGGVGCFAGLVSQEPFDEVRITCPTSGFSIDDLHFGGPPSGDLDGDGHVGVTDFLMLLADWGPCPQPCLPPCSADLDLDCNVGVQDFLSLLLNWG